jgi:hypothetical protein
MQLPVTGEFNMIEGQKVRVCVAVGKVHDGIITKLIDAQHADVRTRPGHVESFIVKNAILVENEPSYIGHFALVQETVAALPGALGGSGGSGRVTQVVRAHASGGYGEGRGGSDATLGAASGGTPGSSAPAEIGNAGSRYDDSDGNE